MKEIDTSSKALLLSTYAGLEWLADNAELYTDIPLGTPVSSAVDKIDTLKTLIMQLLQK